MITNTRCTTLKHEHVYHDAFEMLSKSSQSLSSSSQIVYTTFWYRVL